MFSRFLQFELHNGKIVKIKPYEIVTISDAPEGGARIVTRQVQTFYVVETPNDVENMIELHFEKIRELKEGN